MSHAGIGWGGSCRVGLGGSYRGGGRSCRGGMDHVGVGWVMQGWGGVGHTRVGWGGNYRVLNLEMHRISNLTTIMELQVIESLTPKY